MQKKETKKYIANKRLYTVAKQAKSSLYFFKNTNSNCFCKLSDYFHHDVNKRSCTSFTRQ